MPPSRKSKPPRRSRGSHTTGRPRVDRRLDPEGRPHVATMATLIALGWRVAEIRPRRVDEPVLWRVTIDRYDGAVSITAIDAADPDTALEELARYAAADAEDPR